jgi:hypothetical protein
MATENPVAVVQTAVAQTVVELSGFEKTMIRVKDLPIVWSTEKYLRVSFLRGLLWEFQCDATITPAEREQCRVMHDALCDELDAHQEFFCDFAHPPPAPAPVSA